jgi:hypothetical protein
LGGKPLHQRKTRRVNEDQEGCKQKSQHASHDQVVKKKKSAQGYLKMASVGLPFFNVS